MTVIENGVDTQRFSESHDRRAIRPRLGLPEDCYLIGTVGRLHPVKGYADLVAALGRLAHMNGDPPHVMIAGYAPPEEEQRLLQQARELHVEHLLHLLGRRDDVPEVLAAMDVFTLPSHSEGMPNALLEAMAAGKPSVATRVGGCLEVMVDGETGVFVPPHSPEALADALAGLRADPTRAARLGAAAQTAMRSRAWPAVVAQYAELLFP